MFVNVRRWVEYIEPLSWRKSSDKLAPYLVVYASYRQRACVRGLPPPPLDASVAGKRRRRRGVNQRSSDEVQIRHPQRECYSIASAVGLLRATLLVTRFR